MNIKGSKINLRYATLKDADSMAQHANDMKISEFTFIPYPYDVNDAVEFINHTIDVRQDKSGLHLAIEEKVTGNVIGMIGFNVINYTHHNAELGYWVAQDYWGKGVSVEAVNLLINYTFEQTEIERVYAYVQPENIASWRLLEKTGFEREGLLKKLLLKEGKRYDHYIYARLKE